MQFAFDLISDLHVETWDEFNWEGQPTSPYCVVAGDVGRDPYAVARALKHLGEQYAGVFYIDGNDEHAYGIEDLNASYQNLSYYLDSMKHVVYMQDNVVIINGVAILATNGWWSYDFDEAVDHDQSLSWYRDYSHVSQSAANGITGVAYHDAAYLCNSVRRLQTQPDVKHIVLVSHTVPAPWLVNHDIDLADTVRFNTLGNRHLQLALDEDTEDKVRAWCFGHYHRPVDRYFAGIRYVCNPRGRGNTPWVQNPYYPKRIEIDL